MQIPGRIWSGIKSRNLLPKSDFPLKYFNIKVAIYQETENFILKTAENPFELRQALSLRHEIFYKEMQNKELASRLDIDEFDPACDHLIIIDKAKSKIVGTYRINCTLFSTTFYSESEFAMKDFLALPGTKLELGRACIHKDYRNGTIINLLWKGICEYVKKTNADYIFGCASVQSESVLEIAAIRDYLKDKGLVSEEVHVAPQQKYESTELAALGPATTEVDVDIPALIQSYILAGARFYGEPAHDKDFQCYDFFMALKVSEMSRLFKKKYGFLKT